MRRARWSGVLAAAVGTVIAGAVVVPLVAAPPVTTLAFVSSVPAQGSSGASPSVLSATYNGLLEAATATVTLKDSGDSVVGTTAPTLSGNKKTVSAVPSSPLTGGSYTVTFDVWNEAHTQHPTPQVVSFTVTGSTPPAPTAVVFDAPATATDTVVVVSGAGVSGNTINVSVDDTDGGTTAVVPASPVTVVSGSWSASVDVASLTDGTLTATVTQSNGGGTSSAATATVLKDATAPAAPTGVAFDAPAKAGDTSVVLSGAGETGAIVSISVDDTDSGTSAVVPGTTTVTGGQWSASIDVTSLSDGTLTATVVQADGVGNVSTSAMAMVVKDTSVPAAPSGMSFDGPAKAGDTTVVLSGTGETGAALDVSIDDTSGGTTAVTGSTTVVAGSWSVSLDVASLDDGTLTATVTQTDGVGNESDSATKTVAKDASVPGAPSALAFDGPARAGDTSVVLSGIADNGATVSFSIDDAVGGTSPVAGTTTVTDGQWSTPVEVASLADGTLTATVTQLDEVGNESDAATTTVVKDVGVPTAPLGLVFDGPANAADTEVVLSGDGETGATVSISVDDGDSGTAAVTDTVIVVAGQWTSASLNLGGLADGILTATVTQADAVGNVSPPSTRNVLKDIVLPDAPTGLQFDGPARLADTSLLLTGDGETGATVTYTVVDADGGPTISGSAVVVGGQWTSPPLDVSGFVDGTLTATATQQDLAGNEGPGSTGAVTAKDVVVPAAPTGLAFDGVATGADKTLVLSGNGENGATVSISVNDADGQTAAVNGQATVSGTTWSSAGLNLASLADGTLTATVAQSDAVGNTSSTATKNVLKDTLALAPASMAFNAPVNLKDKQLVLTGTGEPGAETAVRLADAVAGTPAITKTPAVGDGGNWTATFAYTDVLDLADGILTATVRQTDGVGNQSPASTATVKKDTKKPTVALLSPVARFTLGATRVSWNGTGATSYDVGYTQSKSGGYLGSAVYPDSWQGVTASSVTRDQPLGTTGCYFVRGRDSVGNTSFYTPQRCITRPFDDRRLSVSGAWTKATGKAFYQQTVRRTTQRGATLTLGTTWVYRVALVATTCDGCGKVAVLVNGLQVGTFDLDSSRTRHRRVLSMTVPEQSGKVALKVISSRKTVEVDGFAVTRL